MFDILEFFGKFLSIRVSAYSFLFLVMIEEILWLVKLDMVWTCELAWIWDCPGMNLKYLLFVWVLALVCSFRLKSDFLTRLVWRIDVEFFGTWCDFLLKVKVVYCWDLKWGEQVVNMFVRWFELLAVVVLVPLLHFSSVMGNSWIYTFCSLEKWVSLLLNSPFFLEECYIQFWWFFVHLEDLF